MFWYNTLFTYASQHIPLIIVRWFWWALASIWMYGYSVQWQAKTISPHNTKAVPCFWQSISRPAETTFSQIRFGKSDEIRLCLLCCGGCREERNLLYILKIWNIVFRHWSFGSPPKSYCPPPSIFCLWPGGPYGPHWEPRMSEHSETSS